MNLKQGEKVNLIIGRQTALGYTVLINETVEGLLYNNEIFQDIKENMLIDGYIKKLREDGKIDVSLRPEGFKNVIDTDVEKILQKLKKKKVLMLTDKSSPKSIKFHLQMSKKSFKKAIGSLYKQQKIKLFCDRIELLKK